MTTPDVFSGSATTSVPSPAVLTTVSRADAPPSRTLLWQALLIGISADALLRDGPVGPALAVWLALLALTVLSLTWSAGRDVPREALGWLGTAIVLAALTIVRDTEILQVLDLFAVIFALSMAAIALRRESDALGAHRLRDTIWAGAVIVGSAARGVVSLALRELLAADRTSGATDRRYAVLRAACIMGALAFVFGSLLSSADPIFARLVAMPDLDFGTILSHVIVAGFFAWIVGGWAYGALIAVPTSHRAPDRFPIALSALDVTTALGTINVLLGAFVLTQLGWFFGGAQFLHATTGLTVAEYARRGFFQMVWVVVLLVGLLLATRATLAPGRSLARRHTLLSLPIVALLAAILLSAALRMRLYVQYYGLTTDRLSTLVFMGWLAIVLGLLTVTVLRDRGRFFVAGSVLSGLAVLLVLNTIAPDRLVARVNIARAGAPALDSTRALDLTHLAGLSGDAADVVVPAVLTAPRRAAGNAPLGSTDEDLCYATSRLLSQWGPTSGTAERQSHDGAWRRWNAGESHALRVVGANSARLRLLKHESCGAQKRARLASGQR